MIASALLFYAMIGEANRKLPQDQQIPYLFLYPGKIGRVNRDYKSFYPESKLPLIRFALNCVAFIFMVAVAVKLGFFH